jgi:enediyne biosynthesis protein E3
VDIASIRRLVFGISPDETRFDRRGFAPAQPDVEKHLETAGCAFVGGYNTALAKPHANELVVRLNDVELLYRGFAFEGAAMALTLLDLITPWNRRRFFEYVNIPTGNSHVYMLHVGVGWGIARIPWARRNFERVMARYHPLYRWLTLDGYGFHEGFFYTRRYVAQHQTPRGLSTDGAHVFDQGLGRSMWFSQGADATRIAAVISAFPPGRQQDLWSGAGLAATYAGGVTQDVLEALVSRAGGAAPAIAQGAAFAAKARQRAGNLNDHTELACSVFCGCSPDEAAKITDECLTDLPDDGPEPAYAVWRARIQQRFAQQPSNGTSSRGSALAAPSKN